MLCDKFCPFHKECEHCDTLVGTAKTPLQKIEKIHYDDLCDVHTTQNSLENVFIEAQNAADNKIHLIMAQAGLGKSTTYLKYLENSHKPYIIAVPTNELKLELLEKALNKGYDVISTPSLPDNIPEYIQHKIDKMYSCGAGRNVSKYIRSISKNDETDVFEEYIENLERINNFSGHIITTHARLLTFSEQFLRAYNIIIDEDIMRTLMPIKQVNLHRVKKLLHSDKIGSDKKKRLNELFKGLSEGIFLSKRDTNISFNEKEISEILKSNNSGNIIEFLSATVVHQPDNDSLQYLIRRNLPNRKILLLSATANENLYKLYFGDYRVTTYNITDAKYMGKLIQYPSAGFSRNFFTNNPIAIKILRICLELQM